ncbi:MAG: hypothetical protein M1542_08270 [Thermotogae bacterium]|jgi:preprotein translocase subunit SecB|nr:hypothetical protein [Thermotogota bacterium]MCL5033222.1 hypothetical protein [Thermotogota bacterium]
MNAEKSIFSFDEYSITDIQYTFDRNLMAQNRDKMVDFSVQFTPEIQINELESKLDGIVQLRISVEGKVENKNLVNASVNIFGKFSSSDLGKDKFDQYCRLSGVATLFQIARAVVISFTSQTGNTPIIIPLTNISSSQQTTNEKTKK